MFGTLARLLLNYLEKAFIITAVLFLAIMGVISILQIFCRYVLNHGLVWAFPVVMLLFIWLVFLGAFVVYRRKKDIAVKFIVNLIPQAYRSFSVLVTNLVVVGLLLVLLAQFPSIARQQNTQMNIIHLPRYVQSLPLFIGIACILLEYVIDSIEVTKAVLRKTRQPD